MHSLLLDLRSITLVLALVCAVLSIMMALIWKTRKTYPGFGYWTAGDALNAVGFLLIALRGMIADALSIVLANVLLLGAAALFLKGVRSFRGVAGRTVISALLIVLQLLVTLYFTFVIDNVGVRIISFSLLTMLLFAMGALDLLRNTPQDLRFSFWLTGGLFAVQALFMLARALLTGLGPAFGDLFAPNLIQTATFVWALLMGVSMTFGFLMLNSERLEADLKKAQVELQRLAKTDFLTGIANNRSFFETGEREIQRARRYGRPLVVLMFDLDHFKEVNDTYGHAVGDRVLVAVAATCRYLLRDVDLFGRLGGEEFGVLLPETDLAGGRSTAERLRAAIAETAVDVDGAKLRITISIGAAVLSPEDVRIEEPLKRADDAMYEAKRSGRNRVVAAVPLPAGAGGLPSS